MAINIDTTATGDGSQTAFPFDFKWLRDADIKVTVNGTAVDRGTDPDEYVLTSLNYSTKNGGTVTFNTAPLLDDAIRIYRETDADSLQATFTSGSAIRAKDLNDDLTQVLYVSEETRALVESTDSTALQGQVTIALNNSSTALSQSNSALSTANGLAASISTANSNATTAVNTANAASATANAISGVANAALPKAGGTMTGDITFSDSGEGVIFADSSKISAISNSTSTTSSVTAASSTAVKAVADASVPLTSISNSTTSSSQTTVASSLAIKTTQDLLDALDASFVGAVMAFAANAAPTGWVKCNGAAVNRTGTYARLWTFAQASGNLAASEGAKQAGQFGPGNGTTTFTLPDLRGEFVRGWADDRSVDTGRVIGTAQGDDYKQHSHGVTDPGHTHQILGNTGVNNDIRVTIAAGSGSGDSDNTQSATTGITINNSPTTGGTETRPRNVALLYCVKY